MDLIKSVDAPAPINSASLHPEKDFFVAGGEDFKLYKFDYGTKEELGEKRRIGGEVVELRPPLIPSALPSRVLQGPLRTGALRSLQSRRRALRQWLGGRDAPPVADRCGENLRPVEVHPPR